SRNIAVARPERGASPGEVVFILFFIAAVAVGLYALLGRKSKPEPGSPSNPSASAVAPPPYKCLTTPDKLIPIKAVVTAVAGADVYESAATTSRVVEHAKTFATYVA